MFLITLTFSSQERCTENTIYLSYTLQQLRTGKAKKRDYIKLHIVIDVDKGIILQYTITDWKGADPTEFSNVVGDKAYSSRANCQAAADKKVGVPISKT
jgi:hypothetical protein